MSVHIQAKPGEIAETVLMPGDPLRAKFIAETMLEGAVLFNQVRGMFGYTGTFEGRRVSVMGSGMGQPSLSIYANELLREYGVRRLIRVGTCGATLPGIECRSVVLALSASTDSAINDRRLPGVRYAPAASFGLLCAAHEAARTMGLPVRVGQVLSSDSFYSDDAEAWKLYAAYGIVAVEMESAELYTLAAKFGAEALAILTVSDNMATGELTSSAERERSFASMARLALKIA